MEKIMSKTNDTERTRELNDAELAAVSGGMNAFMAGAVAGAAKGVGPGDDGKLPTLPCDAFDIICRILS
jgi:bacteriocin-like protein